MRFKEFLHRDDGHRYYYPDMRPYDQSKQGPLFRNFERENIDTLKKFRIHAANIIDTIRLGMQNVQRRYIGVTMSGTPENGVLHNIHVMDIERSEGGRQQITMAEIQWALGKGILMRTADHERFDMNLSVLNQMIHQMQQSIDDTGSILSGIERGYDFFMKPAMQGHLQLHKSLTGGI